MSRLRKTFANGPWANKKSSRTQLHRIRHQKDHSQSEGFLGRLLGPFSKTGLPLIGNVLKPLAKSVLISLGLTAVASATDVAIHKKMVGSGHLLNLASRMITLIISNEEINDIIKIIKSLEESGLLIKTVNKTIKNEAKEQKGGFLSMLLGTLGASLLESLLTSKDTIRAGECTIRSRTWFLMLPHPLINFEIQRYYQNEPKFNGVYSRNNLPKIKDEAYVINLDEYKSIRTHWIALRVNAENITYFDSFGSEHIPKEV